MNILFISLINFNSISEHHIYTDLLREFVKHGHTIYAISPVEKRCGIKTHCIKEDGVTILKQQIGNTQKVSILEKGISILTLESVLVQGAKRYFGHVKFDMVIYPTPPITVYRLVSYIKKRDHAVTYLLLKDIFPQNAVDMGMLATKGVKNVIYKIFREKEKKLYAVSDFIGCMSEANVTYLLKHNPYVKVDKVEICPNSLELLDYKNIEEDKTRIRNQYNIPPNATVLLYGGNLGIPQGIDFLIECVCKSKDMENIFYVIVGSGTEYHKLDNFMLTQKPKNALLIHQLPREAFDELIKACDIGLIFLNKRFTIPNFPSRLLSYMEAKMPVLAATDTNTDIGKVIEQGDFGLWSESGDWNSFYKNLISLCENYDLKSMGEKSYQYFQNHYTTKQSYTIISKHFKNEEIH